MCDLQNDTFILITGQHINGGKSAFTPVGLGTYFITSVADFMDPLTGELKPA